MQLAASVQRAHPPPVPPRPSRQVVAEALKKSPRPPCPTRQAPPPPNQRPWRSEEQKGVQDGGRTIVYDSAHLQQQQQQQKSNGKLPSPSERRPPLAAKVVGLQLANGKLTTAPTAMPRIEDTSRRKDQTNYKNNNNNNNNNNNGEVNDNEEIEEEKGMRDRMELKTEVIAAKKNVTFVETKAIVEATSCNNNNVHDDDVDNDDKDSSAKNKENCATVVVIDETEISSSRLQQQKSSEEPDNIQRLDWLEAGVRYSATKITLPAEESNNIAATATRSGDKEMLHEGEDDAEVQEEEEEEEEEGAAAEFADLDFSSIIKRIAMSSLQGLPPLPRSLSGFNLNGAGLEPPPPPPARSTSKASQRSVKTPSSTTSLSSQSSRPSPQGRQLTTLDTQLAILRREMFGLRQLDLSLLSQLWSLNESIQEFRQLLQEQEDRVPSPSPSSEEGDDTSYSGSGGGQPLLHQPPPPPRRPPSHHRHHHHHRASRSSQLVPSDDSPSSEEYGAV